MLLVLANPGDGVATGVARAAAGSGVPWRWLTPGDLGTARWVHSLDGGSVRTRVVTADGRGLDLADATGVLNRVAWLPPVALSRAEDREYAMAERHALLTSVLASLTCPVVNPVQPPSLAGPMLDLAGWTALAARCRLPTRGLRATIDGRRWSARGWQPLPWRSVLTQEPVAVPAPHPAVPIGPRPVVWAEPVGAGPQVTVVGDRVFGAPDSTWAAHARRLAATSGCPLLQISLGTRGDSFVLVEVEHTPDTLPQAAFEALLGMLTPMRGSAPGAAP